jgi:hypothetical protein
MSRNRREDERDEFKKG